MQPQDLLAEAYREFEPQQIAISFSGAEDVVLIDMASKLLGDRFQVFTLDTGRLHAETYGFIEEVRQHYGLQLEVLSPNAESIQRLVREKGLFSFYEDGHQECCGIRKVQPLQRKLAGLDAWITGQRKDQATTRSAVPSRQIDQAFSTSKRQLIKFNPLADWTSIDVWDYLRAENVPYNKLHDQGFMSIGCAPCTRAIKAGEPERAGRWWWEHEQDKECGLHAQNLKTVPLVVQDS